MFPTGLFFSTKLSVRFEYAAVGICLYILNGCGASHQAHTVNKASCESYEDDCPGEKRLYRSSFVRECLRLERQNLARDSQICWAELNKRIVSDPDFVSQQKFTDSDLTKIRRKVEQSDRVSSQLEQELQTCSRSSPKKRDIQITCYQDYLKRNTDKLSRFERFEVEQSITTLQENRDRAPENQEETLEFVGKLLGLQLHVEDAGIRIDSVLDGLVSAAGFSEQDLLLAVDDVLLSELSADEAITQLEACRNHPIKLLSRHGGINQVRYTLVEVDCGTNRSARRISQETAAPITCSSATSQELNLGLSLCFYANDGLLEITEVCQGSPAAEAGVVPGHRYMAIDNQRLLGKSYDELQRWLIANPTPLFSGNSGALNMPLRLKAAWSDPGKSARCRAALRSRLEKATVKTSEP